MRCFEQKEAERDAGWVRHTAVRDGKTPVRTMTRSQAMTAPHDCPCLANSHHTRACSGRCPTRVCAAGGGSPALPTLPAWSRACPVTCYSPAPAPSPPARCPPAASTSTPTRPAAAAPALSLQPATASPRRNVSLGAPGLVGGFPQCWEVGGSLHWRSSVLLSGKVGSWGM